MVGFPATQRQRQGVEEPGEPPLPGERGIEAKRAKSLLSEQLLNPYADEADSADGDATMCAPCHCIILWHFYHCHAAS